MKLPALVPPRRRLIVWSSILALVAAGAPRLQRENFFSAGGETPDARLLPPFPDVPSAWIGCAPLTRADMGGRTWVLVVWTFGCANCLRSIPFTNSLVERFGADVGVLGIHSPEFDWERDPERLKQAMSEHDMRFPTFIDQSLDYFMALEVSAWPAHYVIDRQGRIRGCWFGEIHAGTARARALEELIRKLTTE